MKIRILSFLVLFVSSSSCSQVNPPEPFGPLPSERQLKWHEMEYYMFVHFTVNTFTDKEWGYGDEKDSVFNPSELDCRQWAKTAKEAGMKGIIIYRTFCEELCMEGRQRRYSDGSPEGMR
jgi:alpha-L-fucosidase